MLGNFWLYWLSSASVFECDRSYTKFKYGKSGQIWTIFQLFQSLSIHFQYYDHLTPQKLRIPLLEYLTAKTVYFAGLTGFNWKMWIVMYTWGQNCKPAHPKVTILSYLQSDIDVPLTNEILTSYSQTVMLYLWCKYFWFLHTGVP